MTIDVLAVLYLHKQWKRESEQLINRLLLLFFNYNIPFYVSVSILD
jgi:hypothetical protein